jgi:hypothetical protein
LSDQVNHDGVLLRELRAQQVVWGQWYYGEGSLENDIRLRQRLIEDLQTLSLARARVEAHCVAAGTELALARQEVLWCNDPGDGINSLEDLRERVQQVSVLTWCISLCY